MTGNTQENPENGTGNSPETIQESTVYSYNLDDRQTPGGLKVRFKIRVETGQRAAHWDAVQAEAIREVLAWARARNTQQEPR